MLSSAKKSVPTIKQFVQPYFIWIAPTGALAAVCNRFENLLKRKSILNYLNKRAIDVFLQLGPISPLPDPVFFDPKFSPTSLPAIFDLAVDLPRSSSFTIRWVS